ncbi:MAG: diguanylate cyclase [Chloroflexi bacterium]|nr:diguanylate cyclase [Chloroflexota bacterium]
MHAPHAALRFGIETVGPASRLARFVSLPARLRTSEYTTVGASARFRAQQRRRTVSAARVGFLFIAGAALFDAVMLVDREPAHAVPLIALNGGVVLLAVAGWRLIAHSLRRRPDPVAAAVTLALIGATAATGLIIPALTIESAGYLILFPVVVTLILPWSTRTHVRWLAGSAALAIGYLVVAPTAGLSAEGRADLVIVNLVAIGASLAGHALLQLAAIRNHSQMRKIMQLRRRADANVQELARVHRRLEETARTDPLTGARNRLRLEEDLRVVRARMHRLGEAHGLIAFDLDRFKLINDERGHLAGDDVLKAVVQAVRGTIRADDEIYRFGGEEFLVLVRVADLDGVHVASERIRQAIIDLAITHDSNTPHGLVTASLGAALVTSGDLAASDDEWFARTDVAMYQAKDLGRNRVVMAAAIASTAA